MGAKIKSEEKSAKQIVEKNSEIIAAMKKISSTMDKEIEGKKGRKTINSNNPPDQRCYQPDHDLKEG
ncbi:MAG TPA: hypothetical protein PLK12_08680 [Prolixibacteraceae bacterium]|nr:hypothetical protein [Prolixibacteraceae bacterium]